MGNGALKEHAILDASDARLILQFLAKFPLPDEVEIELNPPFGQGNTGLEQYVGAFDGKQIADIKEECPPRGKPQSLVRCRSIAGTETPDVDSVVDEVNPRRFCSEFRDLHRQIAADGNDSIRPAPPGSFHSSVRGFPRVGEYPNRALSTRLASWPAVRFSPRPNHPGMPKSQTRHPDGTIRSLEAEFSEWRDSKSGRTNVVGFLE